MFFHSFRGDLAIRNFNTCEEIASSGELIVSIPESIKSSIYDTGIVHKFPKYEGGKDDIRNDDAMDEICDVMKKLMKISSETEGANVSICKRFCSVSPFLVSW